MSHTNGQLKRMLVVADTWKTIIAVNLAPSEASVLTVKQFPVASECLPLTKNVYLHK